LHLVRHAEAASGWGSDADPGLSELGQRQAAAAAEALVASLSPRAVVTSPLRRTRETAAPIVRAWGTEAEVVAAFGEIPSPSDDLAERAAWLPGALRGRWGDLDEAVGAWRAALIEAALAVERDVVVVTHFVAINALVGHALGRDEVTTFLPANASVTVLDALDGRLEVVERGGEAPPVVG
jgi:broad specificity phosphatase PhoE